MRAVRLLREMGYTRVWHYSGGMADWKQHGLPVEKPVSERRTAGSARAVASSAVRRRFGNLMEGLLNRSVWDLAVLWLGMVLGFAGLYWVVSMTPLGGLHAGGLPVTPDLSGFLTALYFSFVTATSVGYGDVTPGGVVRALAVCEAASELLIFGMLVSRFVSRRQDELIEEIHRTTFEDRLGRVRTNLHVILADLQEIAEMCGNGHKPTERLLARVESAAAVFAGEMSVIHDLLYRPQQNPDEPTLESILTSLLAGMREIDTLREDMPADYRASTVLRSRLRSISGLASEICGECVPRVYAPALKDQMDRIQEIGRSLAAA